MLGHISKFDGNNSLIKHGVVQGNNIVDLDLLRNFNGVPGLGNDSNLLIVFYVQIMPDDFVMQLHR
ncbi:hypothetical protein N6O26_22045, partial [Escherichia coli]